MVNVGAQIAHNARTHRHEHSRRGEITRGLEQGGGDEKQTNEQKCHRRTIFGHNLLREIIHVVDDDVFHRHVGSVPGDELVDVVVYLKKQVEHRYQRHEREDVEQRRKQIEKERTKQILAVWLDVFAHHFEEIFHRMSFFV